MKKIDIFAGMDMSPEGIEKRQKESYNRSKQNPENMSYWLPEIAASTTRGDSVLKIPETKILQLDYENWKWLRSDGYKPEAVADFNTHLINRLDEFGDKEEFFMKTGIFSNKFDFQDTVIRDRETVGSKYLSIFYASMMVGADETSEVVFRELIEDKEQRETIYNGMPLHTEFRVFYDFDSKKEVGIVNYWHPDVMKGGLRSETDLEIYKSSESTLIAEYEEHKFEVIEEVKKFMRGEDKISGKWSIDVMKNGDEYWLIDMARMEKSSLVAQMERLSES